MCHFTQAHISPSRIVTIRAPRTVSISSVRTKRHDLPALCRGSGNRNFNRILHWSVHMVKAFPYQVFGAHWLAGKKYALLADEMRVGKTLQVVTACNELMTRRVLVICPAIAREHWRRNFEQSFDIPVTTIQVVKDFSQDKMILKRGVVIASYSALSRADSVNRFKGPWDVIICDEAHYLKTPTSARTRALLGKSGLVHHSKRMWMLTGTPVMNHVAELWPMLYVFGHVKETYDDFVEKYCITRFTPYGLQILGTNKDEVGALKSVLSGFMLRRTLKEVWPEVSNISVNEFVIKGLDSELEEISYIFQDESDIFQNALASDDPLGSLEAYSEHVATIRRLIGMAKVLPAFHYIKSMNLDKLVVFAHHVDVVTGLNRLLNDKGLPSVMIHGGTTDREKAIDLFMNNDKIRVFVGQIQAAGTAIDLSVADTVMFVESSWVPAENNQALMRVLNLAKQTTVNVEILTLKDSIDEDIQRVIKRKLLTVNELMEKPHDD